VVTCFLDTVQIAAKICCFSTAHSRYRRNDDVSTQ